MKQNPPRTWKNVKVLSFHDCTAPGKIVKYLVLYQVDEDSWSMVGKRRQEALV